MPCCHIGQEYWGPMLAAVNCVWLKMLYISARNRSCRLSLFSGKALPNVISQLRTRVPGTGIRLPAPALPKQDIDCPMPCCGVGPGVQLHGNGITNTLS